MIIGITGKAGSGKDTAAAYLKTKGFEQVSFAAPLKKMMDAVGLHEPSNREDKEALIDGFPFSWREGAQDLGTKWGRGLDPDLWVKLLKRLLDPSKNYVISDVRFENEAAMVRKQGVMVFLYGREAKLQGTTAAHVSEHPLMLYPSEDFMVDNKRTIAELYTQLDTVLHYSGVAL